jgi:pimeloyl-ACP methyl ester carboxylesterase
MSGLFKSDEARAKVEGWFERFRARVPGETASRVLPTSFGDTHLLVGGPEDGPPLVLLHGALASSAHVLSELGALLERFRVYSVDVIGQSVKSAGVRLPVNDDSYGRWLGEVFDGLGLARAHLVGISWGGFVAQRFVAVAPERVERLVLLVPAGVVTGPAIAGFLEVGWPMTKYLLAPSPARLEAFMRGLLTTTDDAEWTGYLGDAFLSYRMQDMKVPGLSRDGEFARLTAPTLVVGADQDVSFPGEALLARAKVLFPSLADTELLRDCRHSPPTTDAFRAWLGVRLTKFLLPA